MSSDYNFIIGILDKLEEKGINILTPANYERFNNVVKEYALNVHVSVFSIGYDYSTRYVLRYEPSKDDFIDLSKRTNEGLDAYKSENYDLCIKSLKPILRIDKPRAFLYTKLGLAYAKNYDYDTAKDYLIIATELLKIEESKRGILSLELRELIEQLKKFIALKTPKPIFHMTDENVEKFKTALSDTKADFDDLCARVNMNKKQKALMCIWIAVDFYTIGDFLSGDYYLKKVDEIDHCSHDVSMLLQDVEKHKYSYQPRCFIPRYFGELNYSNHSTDAFGKQRSLYKFYIYDDDVYIN